MNITEEQLNKLFELAALEHKINLNEITSADISEALVEIERKLYSFSSEVRIDALEDKKILIADDLELSIYKLSTILKKIGINPRVARHKEEALAELQKNQFDCIILDLFIPDSSDGLELIKTAAKKVEENGTNCKVVVISGTDDKSLIEQCYENGADFFIPKDKDWHTNLLKYLSSSFKPDKTLDFTRYVINNNIVSFDINRFNDTKVFDSIIKSINSSLYTGIKHVLFNLKNVSDFDLDNAYIFAEIYKICVEHNGKFVLVNPPAIIKEALSSAYLEEVIPHYPSVENAISDILNQNSNVQ